MNHLFLHFLAFKEFNVALETKIELFHANSTRCTCHYYFGYVFTRSLLNLRKRLPWSINVFFKLGHSRPLFSLFSSFQQLTVIKSISPIFADGKIEDLQCWNQLLYQLSHSNFPTSLNILVNASCGGYLFTIMTYFSQIVPSSRTCCDTSLYMPVFFLVYSLLVCYLISVSSCYQVCVTAHILLEFTTVNYWDLSGLDFNPSMCIFAVN